MACDKKNALGPKSLQQRSEAHAQLYFGLDYKSMSQGHRNSSWLENSEWKKTLPFLSPLSSHWFAGKREQRKPVWSPAGSWDPQNAWQPSVGGERCSWGGYPQPHCPPHGRSPGCWSQRQPAAIRAQRLQQQCWRYGGSHVPWACCRSRLNSFSCFICRIGWALWKFNPACIFLVYVLVYYKMPWNLTQMLPLHKNYHSSFRMGKIQLFSSLRKN